MAAGHAVVSYDDDFGGVFSSPFRGRPICCSQTEGRSRSEGPSACTTSAERRRGQSARRACGRRLSWFPRAAARSWRPISRRTTSMRCRRRISTPTSTQYDFRLSGTRPALAVTADGGHFAASGVIGYDEAPIISLFERLAGNPRMPYACSRQPPVLGMAFFGRWIQAVRGGARQRSLLRVLSSPLQAGSIISLTRRSPRSRSAIRWTMAPTSRSASEYGASGRRLR